MENKGTRKLKLPSGAELSITLASFPRAKALQQAVLKECGPMVKVGDKFSMLNSLKDFACVALSSPTIEACLVECLKSCTYNGSKITDETFEPAEARQDHPVVMYEVMQDNIGPFLKSLFALLSPHLGTSESTPA